ncbi:STAS domain-containing protein [Streptomyces bungoensis]|uniref:STAS domain-containing protein n=1 Tax=Streptomyces bungoensis TaxID=285568 RepID=UPI003404E4AD
MHDPYPQAPSLRRQGRAGDGGPVKRQSPNRAAASYSTQGDRIRVTVRGELDFRSGDRLRDDLCAALAGSTRGLDLDLGGLDFCDCSGLNVLLDLRRVALDQKKTVVIRTSNPMIDRLLTLLGAQGLFASPRPERAERVTVRLRSPKASTRVLTPGRT